MIQLKIALLLIVLIILLSLVFLGLSVIATGGKCAEPPVPAKNGGMKCRAENGIWIVFKPKAEGK